MRVVSSCRWWIRTPLQKTTSWNLINNVSFNVVFGDSSCRGRAEAASLHRNCGYAGTIWPHYSPFLRRSSSFPVSCFLRGWRFFLGGGGGGGRERGRGNGERRNVRVRSCAAHLRVWQTKPPATLATIRWSFQLKLLTLFSHPLV